VATATLAYWERDELVATRKCRLSATDPTIGASSILPGGFCLRKDVFTAVGGFDESLSYSENQDLGLRILDHFSAVGGRAVVRVPTVLVDFHREAASTRVRRYRSAPADSARVFLYRYESRLAGDPRSIASLLRVISRSDRHEGQLRAAISASARACRLQPLYWANYKCLALALLSAPAKSLAGIARRREESP
jgi:hypothetical protein